MKMATGGTLRYAPSCPRQRNPRTDLLSPIQTAYAIKWAVIAAILVAFLLYFVGGYFHARQRMKKGLPPLKYHRVCFPSLVFSNRKTKDNDLTWIHTNSGSFPVDHAWPSPKHIPNTPTTFPSTAPSRSHTAMARLKAILCRPMVPLRQVRPPHDFDESCHRIDH